MTKEVTVWIGEFPEWGGARVVVLLSSFFFSAGDSLSLSLSLILLRSVLQPRAEMSPCVVGDQIVLSSLATMRFLVDDEG